MLVRADVAIGIPGIGGASGWHALRQSMMPAGATVAIVCSTDRVDLRA